MIECDCDLYSWNIFALLIIIYYYMCIVHLYFVNNILDDRQGRPYIKHNCNLDESQLQFGWITLEINDLQERINWKENSWSWCWDLSSNVD